MPSEAVRTDAVQIQPVLRRRKPVLADKALLQGFDLRIDDLNALAAALADEMIVVPVAGLLIPDDAPAERNFLGKPGLTQQLHRAVYRGLPHRRILSLNPAVQIVNGQVPLFLKKHGNDGSPLLRVVTTFSA